MEAAKRPARASNGLRMLFFMIDYGRGSSKSGSLVNDLCSHCGADSSVQWIKNKANETVRLAGIRLRRTGCWALKRRRNVNLARAARGVPVAARGLPPRTQLSKACATSKRGPKRVVYLLAVDASDLFLLFYRGKNDQVGRNASKSNPALHAALKKPWSALAFRFVRAVKSSRPGTTTIRMSSVGISA